MTTEIGLQSAHGITMGFRFGKCPENSQFHFVIFVGRGATMIGPNLAFPWSLALNGSRSFNQHKAQDLPLTMNMKPSVSPHPFPNHHTALNKEVGTLSCCQQTSCAS